MASETTATTPAAKSTELKMVVLDRFAFASSKGLMFYDKRPSHFPPAIDVFLWGGLSARTHKVFCTDPESEVGRAIAFILIYLALMFLGIACFVFFPDPDQLDQFQYYVNGIAVMTVMVVILYAGRFPYIKAFHRRMGAMVRDLAPHFQKSGYSITYEKQDRCFSHLAYIRFTPYTDINKKCGDGGEGSTVIELELTHANLRRVHHKRRFKVAVYGFSVYDDLNGKRFVLGRRHLSELDTLMDEFTWGAVSTEMRPFYHCRACIPRSRQFAMVTPVLVHVLGFTALAYVSSSAVAWLLIVYILLACSPTAYCVPWLMYFESWVTTCAESFLFHLVHLFQEDHDVFQQMKQKVKELAPSVEERSGYTLHFKSENTIGYVCFEPRKEARFISSRETHDHLDPLDVKELMEHQDPVHPPEAIHDTINV